MSRATLCNFWGGRPARSLSLCILPVHILPNLHGHHSTRIHWSSFLVAQGMLFFRLFVTRDLPVLKSMPVHYTTDSKSNQIHIYCYLPEKIDLRCRDENISGFKDFRRMPEAYDVYVTIICTAAEELRFFCRHCSLIPNPYPLQQCNGIQANTTTFSARSHCFCFGRNSD